MCLIKNCKGKTAHGVQWGLKHKLCEPHAQEIANRITDNGRHVIAADYLSDYMGLKAMMLEMETVMEQMKMLAIEIESAIQMQQHTPDDADERFRTERADDLSYIRISRVLENYEGYCWFPPCHRIFVAGLSAQDFYWYLAHGYMVKDPGPNIYHGDFTHRYQWHAIMRFLTANFKRPAAAGEWNHTALELYTSLGAGAAKNANVWGKVLDRDGASAPDLVDYPTFSEPNTLHRALREASFKRLTENTNRRFEKRKSALEAAEDLIAQWKRRNLAKWQQWMTENVEPSGPDVAGLLYAWRKNGGLPIGVPTDVAALTAQGPGEAKVAFKAREATWRGERRLANAVQIIKSRLKHSVNEGAYEPFAYKPGSPRYNFIVTPESTAQFAVLAEELENGEMQRVSDSEIAMRVAQSQTSFDVGHYQYGKGGIKKLGPTVLPFL